MVSYQLQFIALVIICGLASSQRCDGTCFRFELADTPGNKRLCPWATPHIECFYGHAEPLDNSFSQVALCAGTVRCLPAALLNSASWTSKRIDGHDVFAFDSVPLFDTDIVLGSCEQPGLFVSTTSRSFQDYFNQTYGAMLAQQKVKSPLSTCATCVAPTMPLR